MEIKTTDKKAETKNIVVSTEMNLFARTFPPPMGTEIIDPFWLELELFPALCWMIYQTREQFKQILNRGERKRIEIFFECSRARQNSLFGQSDFSIFFIFFTF